MKISTNIMWLSLIYISASCATIKNSRFPSSESIYEIYHTKAEVLRPNTISLDSPRVKNIDSGKIFFIASSSRGQQNEEARIELNDFFLSTICKPLGYNRAFVGGWSSKRTSEKVRIHNVDARTTDFLSLEEGSIVEFDKKANGIISKLTCSR